MPNGKRGGEMKCCLCNKPIEAKGSWKKGNNAEPIKKGRCCDICNATTVIPVRLKNALQDKTIKKGR